MKAMSPTSGRRWSVVACQVLLVVLLLGLVEGLARVALFVARGKSTIGLPERTLYLQYRPFVMFGPDWDDVLRPFERSGSSSTYRILLIGGSTAQHFPTRLLEEAFEKKFPGWAFEVVNAAFGGYNARQELIVATIWAPRLKPDMILSLDGANDLSHQLLNNPPGTFYLNSTYELMLKHPWLAPAVHLVRHSQAIQAVRRLQARRRVGSAEQYMGAIPVYRDAQHSLSMLAKGLAAYRVMVLQPFHGFKSTPSPAEQRFTQYRYREPVMKQLYGMLDRHLRTLAAEDHVLYIDGRPVFNGRTETIFSDDVHFVSEEGYRLLADYIVSFIPNDGILANPEMMQLQ